MVVKEAPSAEAKKNKSTDFSEHSHGNAFIHFEFKMSTFCVDFKNLQYLIIRE